MSVSWSALPYRYDPTAKTREEQRARIVVFHPLAGRIASKQCVQVACRRLRVAEMELRELPLLQLLRHCERPPAGIEACKIPYQEIADLRVFVERVHDDAHEQRVLRERLVPIVQAREGLPQRLHRGRSIQLREDAPIASGDAHGPADRAAPLGDHGVDFDVAVHRETHDAPPVDVPAQEECVALGLGRPAGQSSELRTLWESEVQAGEQPVPAYAEGVRQEKEQRTVPRLDLDDRLPLAGSCVSIRQHGLVIDVKGDELHAPQVRPGHRDSRPVLYLSPRSYHSSGGAADYHDRPHPFPHQGRNALELGLMMRGNERDDEADGGRTNVLLDPFGALANGVGQDRSLGNRGEPSHRPASRPQCSRAEWYDSPMTDTVRAFVAADLPPEVVTELARLVSDLAETRVRGLRTVRPEGVHLTLKFLGGVPMREVPALSSAISSVVRRHRPFTLQIGGFGAYPGDRAPRVLWAGVSSPDELVRLRGGIEESMASLGFAADSRRWSPHLTLARIRDGTSKRDRHMAWKALTNLEPISQETTVSSVSLVASRLTPRGAVYSTLETFRMAQNINSHS